MRITVIIPTYRRPADLARTLDSLKNQTRHPDEVVVVVRDEDSETQAFLSTWDAGPLSVRQTIVSVPGQVAALNAGLETAQGDVVAITDDDAAAHADWLERIDAHFAADPELGGLGGRDWVYHNGVLQEEPDRVVGRIQWFGRTIGNHRSGIGSARPVDMLKGANMSYRRSAIGDIRFDTRLCGSGAQVHNDMGFSLEIKKAGWALVYDPAVAVDHFEAVRHDSDQRVSVRFHPLAQEEAVFNETLLLFEYLSLPRRIAFLAWAYGVGTRVRPGLLQLMRLLPADRAEAWTRFRATCRGRLQGVRAYMHFRNSQ